MSLGSIKHDPIIRWFLFVLANDPSLYIRSHMLRIFGKTLGSIAIGENLEASKAQAAQQDGLVIEQEASTEARQTDIARKQTVEGALKALRDELSSNSILKTEIWKAITSPALSLKQMGELLDICELLYDPVNSMKVALRYPRYWTCTKISKGKLLFSRSSRIRTTPTPKRKPPLSSTPLFSPNIKRENSNPMPTMPPPPVQPSLKLKFGVPKKPSVSTTPSTPTSVETVPPSPVGSSQGDGQKKKLILKLGTSKTFGAGSPPL